MNITEIDNKKDLFLIENLVTEELMDKLSKEVLEDIPFTKQEGQEDWKRRKLVVTPGSVFEQIQQQIHSQRESIGTAIERTISAIRTVFWLDMPGFKVWMHMDNATQVFVVMQVYLKDCDDMGTIFYNPKDNEIEIRDDSQKVHYIGVEGSHNPEAIRYEFECKKNTGYLMLNNDRQLHGVPNVLPDGELRLSAYCYFSFEENE